MPAEQPERDVDREFESLIANWDSTPFSNPLDEESPEEKSQGETPADEKPQDEFPDTPGDAGSSTNPLPGPGVNVWRGPSTWRPAEDAFDQGPAGMLDDDADEQDDEDSFTPRPVHLPPQEDLHFWGIVVGLVGGGLLLLWVGLTGASTSSWWFIGAVALFLGGFTLLILRQPQDRDTTDDGTRL